jgi:hypothetical protein
MPSCLLHEKCEALSRGVDSSRFVPTLEEEQVLVWHRLLLVAEQKGRE